MEENLREKYQLLIQEIEATNQAWHAMQELLSEEFALARTSRFLKSRLQLRLLRRFPHQVYLEIDQSAEGEEQYGVILKVPVNGRSNAMHIPVRVIDEWLEEGVISQMELNFWLNNK